MSKIKRQYTFMDVLMASADKPMSKEKQEYQLNLMRDGLNAMKTSESPSSNDWRCVADAINLMETLEAMGLVTDSDGLLKDAVFAMGEAGARAMKGQSLRLSGAGINACSYVIDDYEYVLSQLSERVIINAFMRTEKRISDISKGKRSKQDVQVVSL